MARTLGVREHENVLKGIMERQFGGNDFHLPDSCRGKQPSQPGSHQTLRGSIKTVSVKIDIRQTGQQHIAASSAALAWNHHQYRGTRMSLNKLLVYNCDYKRRGRRLIHDGDEVTPDWGMMLMHHLSSVGVTPKRRQPLESNHVPVNVFLFYRVQLICTPDCFIADTGKRGKSSKGRRRNKTKRIIARSIGPIGGA